MDAIIQWFEKCDLASGASSFLCFRDCCLKRPCHHFFCISDWKRRIRDCFWPEWKKHRFCLCHFHFLGILVKRSPSWTGGSILQRVIWSRRVTACTQGLACTYINSWKKPWKSIFLGKTEITGITKNRETAFLWRPLLSTNLPNIQLESMWQLLLWSLLLSWINYSWNVWLYNVPNLYFTIMKTHISTAPLQPEEIKCWAKLSNHTNIHVEIGSQEFTIIGSATKNAVYMLTRTYW